jgi:hypothetical protein
MKTIVFAAPSLTPCFGGVMALGTAAEPVKRLKNAGNR